MTDERIRIGEAITLEYPPGTVGILRCLVDPAQSPGDTEWTCVVVIDKNKRCTIKILRGRVPNHRERRQLIKYFKAQGCHGGGWSRAKNGKNYKTVLIKG